MIYQRLTQTGSPVTLAEFKAHLRILHNEQDAYLQTLLNMAEGHVQNYVNAVILPGTYQFRAVNFEDNYFPLAPIKAIISIYTIDVLGTQTALAEGDFQFVKRWPQGKDKVQFYNKPALGSNEYPIFINAEAGYDATPAPIQAAILLLAARLYESPADPVSEMKTLADRLLKPYKVY